MSGNPAETLRSRRARYLLQVAGTRPHGENVRCAEALKAHIEGLPTAPPS